MEAPARKLTKRHLAGYTLGDFGECLTFSIMGSFLTRYYINVALIDTAIIALMTILWKTWDAASNPIMGMLMDKVYASSRHPKGKFIPWMLRATPLLAVTAILTVTAPQWVTGASRLVVVFVTYLLYETAYTMFNIPYGSLLSAMAGNDEERASLSSARGIGGMLGNIIAMIFFPVLISAFEENPSLGYTWGVSVCAAAGFILCLLSCRLTEERIMAEPRTADTVKVTDVFEVFRKNRAFQAICIHGICQCVIQGITMSMGTYLFSDVLGDIALISVSSIVTMPVNTLFLIYAPKLSKRFGLERFIRISLVLGAGCYCILFGLHVLLPLNVWVHIILSTVSGALVGAGAMMQWGLVGEVIEYNEFLTGKRTEGSIYGTFNMLRRVGQAVGTSLSVALLGWIGYDVAAANMGLAQSDSVVLGIQFLCILLPAIFAMGSWASFRFIWNITPEIREQMHSAKK